MPVCEAVVFVLFLLCPATIFATCPSYPAVGNPKFTGTGTKSDPFVIAPFVDAGPKSDTMGIRLPYNFGTFVGQTDDNKCDTKEKSVEEPDCMCYASSENVPLVWLENTVIWIPGCASANPPVSGVKPSWIDAYYAVTPNCNANDDDSDASWYCQSTPKLKTFQSNSPPAVSSTIPTLNDGGPRPCIQCQQGTRLKALYNYLPSPELLDSDNVYGYGLTACLACGKGQFQDQTRHIQQSCKNCALGKHAPRVLMDACFDCPPGTSQPALGQAACVPCVAGFYSDEAGQQACKKCPRGRFNGLERQTFCAFCQNGQYQESEQATTCVNCEGGKYATQMVPTQPTSTSAITSSRFLEVYKGYCDPGWYYPSNGKTSGGYLKDISEEAGVLGSYETKLQACFDACTRWGYTMVTAKNDGSCYCYEETNCASKSEASSYTTYRYNISFSRSNGTVSCTSCLPGQSSTHPDTETLANDRCFGCARGKYQDQPSNTDCKACDPGFSTNLTGQSICTSCLPGYASNGLTPTTCNKCAEGTFADVSALSTCKACDKGTFSNVTGAHACVLCGMGTFQNELSAPACKNCERGTFANETGQSTCFPCSAGSYSDIFKRTSACIPCNVGRAQPAKGQTECDFCGLRVNDGVRTGYFQDAAGSTKCKSCPKGQYNDLANASTACKWCSVGLINTEQGGDEIGDCRPCEVGRYGSVDRQSCADCDTGLYQDKIGQPNCTQCDAGKYTSATGKSSCTSCPAGQYGTLVRQTSLNNCTLCPAGRASASPGSQECLSCPKGKYSESVVGSVECLLCTAGYYSTVESISIVNTTAGNCIDCKTISPSGVSFPDRTNCTSCRSFEYSAFGACLNCTQCPNPGEYRDGCGGVQVGICRTCNNETGEYMDENDRLSNDLSRFSKCRKCQPCPKGTERRGATSVSCGTCEKCSVGFYNDQLNGKCVSCLQQCPLSTEQTRSGCGNNTGGTCSSCSSGKYKKFSELTCTPCGSCPIGSERKLCGASNAGQCTVCSPGMYKNVSDAAPCKLCTGCGAGMELNEAGSLKAACANFGSTVSGECAPCSKGRFKPEKSINTGRNANDSVIVNLYSDRCEECPPCPKGHTRTDCKGSEGGTCVKWGAPVITSVSGAAITSRSPTEGRAEILVSGKNFVGTEGFATPPAHYEYVVYYGPVDNITRYRAITSPNIVTDSEGNKRILCTTTSGVGKNYSLRVELYGQTSNIFPAGLTYLPPVLESFSANDRTTLGGKSLVLKGSNFGDGSKMASVVVEYGNNLQSYTARECSVTIAHTQVSCISAPGVGSNLEIRLYVGGQKSVRPTYYYAKPSIIQLNGQIKSANTDGGERIVVQGRNFGPTDYTIPEGAVRIFRQANSLSTEYHGKACNVSVATSNANEIECFTPTGVGQEFTWSVDIGGQVSSPSNTLFGYGKPAIISASASQISTGGGSIISLEGENFGVHVQTGLGSPAREVYYRFTYGKVLPASTDLRSYVRAGKVALSRGTLTFESPELSTLPSEPAPNSATPIYMAVGVVVQPLIGPPVVFGNNGTINIVVKPPYIDTISKARKNSKTIELTLTGTDFCTISCGSLKSPSLTAQEVVFWSHTRIVFRTNAKAGSVYVQVGLLKSTTKSWSDGEIVMGSIVPSNIKLKTRGEANSDDGVFRITGCKVNGNSAAGVVVVFGTNAACTVTGDGPCQIRIDGNISTLSASVFNISVIKTPPGAGANILLSLQYNNESSPETRRVSYAPPSISRVDLMSKNGTSGVQLTGAILPSQGGKVRIKGRNFGRKPRVELMPSSLVTKNNWILSCASVGTDGNFDVVDCTIPRGSGAEFELQMLVGGQVLVDRYVGFGFQPSSFQSFTPSLIPTQGGMLMVMHGQNLCTYCQNEDIVENITLSICTPNTLKCKIIDPLKGNETSIYFLAPEGFGENVFVVVTNGFNDPVKSSDQGVTFSYLPPVIHSVFPTFGRTAGSTEEKVVLRGNNFGSDAVPCFITWGNRRITRFFSHNHTTIIVHLPEGQGRGLNVSISVGAEANVQKGSLKHAFSYLRPSNLRIAPDPAYQSCVTNQVLVHDVNATVVCEASMEKSTCNAHAMCTWKQHYPTSGCDEYENVVAWQSRLRDSTVSSSVDTKRECVRRSEFRFLGENFGKDSTIVYMLDHEGKKVRLEVKLQRHESLTIFVPPGGGKMQKFSIIAYGQEEVVFDNGNEEFSYRPPLPSSIALDDNTRWLNSLGNEEVAVHGSDFGGQAGNISIYINGKLCSNARWEPMGLDDGMPFLKCATTFEMLVGPLEMVISVDGLTGYQPAIRPPDNLWDVATTTLRKFDIDVSDELLGTIMPMFTRGVVNAICKADLAFRPDGSREVYHGAPNELCATCPKGAICLPNTYKDPASMAGFYRVKLDLRDPSSRDYHRAKTVPTACQARRTLFDEKLQRLHPDLRRREYCYEFVNCIPRESCAGFNKCAPGYEYTLKQCEAWEAINGKTKCTTHDDCRRRSGTGGKTAMCSAEYPQNCARCVLGTDRSNTTVGTLKRHGYCKCVPSEKCELCSVGTHYRIDNKCESCPGDPVLLAVFIILGILCFVLFAYWLSRRNFNLAFLSIGVDYFQVVALFTAANVKWPEALIGLLRYMRLFTIDIDVLAPECFTVISIDYEVKWWLTMLAPIGALALLTIGFLIAEAAASCQQKKVIMVELLNSFVSCFIVVFYYGYIILIKRGMEIFDCHERLGKPDGFKYAKFVSAKCENGLCQCDNPEHLPFQLTVPSIVFLLIYSAGFPITLVILLRVNKILIKEDQLLRAAEISPTLETNATLHHIRRRYSQMYYHFRPGKIYWMSFILLRKGSIAVVGLVLSGYPTLKLAVTTIILIVAYVMQAKHEPYMSTSQRHIVLADHRSKVEDGDPKHIAIDKGIQRALAFKRKQKEGRSHKRRRLSAIGKGLEALKNADYNDHQYFFNFNTVEKTLLFCAILVCLSGVIFGSELFEDPKTRDQKVMKDMVGVVVVFILLWSVVYYVLVFATEITGSTPKWLMKMCSEKKSNMELEFEKRSRAKASKASEGGIEMSSSTAEGGSQSALKQLEAENQALKDEMKLLKYTRSLGKSSNAIREDKVRSGLLNKSDRRPTQNPLFAGVPSKPKQKRHVNIRQMS
jgi:hypothetical protein